MKNRRDGLLEKELSLRLQHHTHHHKMELPRDLIAHFWNWPVPCSSRKIYLYSFGTRQWHMQHIYVTEHQYEPLMEQHHLKPGQGRNLVWDTYTNLVAMFGFLMNLKTDWSYPRDQTRWNSLDLWMDQNQFAIMMQPPGQSKCHETLHSMKMTT